MAVKKKARKPKPKAKPKPTPKPPRKAKAKPKPRTKKRAAPPATGMLEVIVRRPTTVLNRGVGAKEVVVFNRFRPARISAKAYRAAVADGTIREADVIHVRRVKGGAK
jgi:outer membrane biosynthesis protein TonB